MNKPLTLTLGALALAAHLGAGAAEPIKVGLMLPSTGTFAALGDMITKGFKLAIDE